MNNILNKYILLFRIKHYIKNTIIYAPLFFSGHLFELQKLSMLLPAFFAFCFMASAIYIFNDICDLEDDQNHPTRKKRPLAEGTIKTKQAFLAMAFCFLMSIMISFYLGNKVAFCILFLYFFLNILYSKVLKKVPIIDIVTLASFFMLRLFYGGLISDIVISQWLYLVVMSGSFYLVLGKRRNELMLHSSVSRDVLKHYSVSFLTHNMYVSSALTVVFYALWTIHVRIPGIIWTTPLLVVLLMYYSYVLEGNSEGDPVDVVFQERGIFIIVLVFTLSMFFLLYSI